MPEYRRIGIDARLAGARHAGIGRYEAEIISRLVAEPKFLDETRKIQVQWVIWLHSSDDGAWLPQELPAWVQVKRTSVRHYSLAEQWLWPLQLRSVACELLWVPHFNVPVLCPFPWVVTLHDLLWHKEKDARSTTLPGWKHFLKHRVYTLVTRLAAQRAESVIVPSKEVGKDVKSRFGKELNIHVTPEGVAEIYRTIDLVNNDSQSSQTHPRIVYVGSLYPHKNLEVVLQSLRGLPEFTLEVVSTRSVFTEAFLERADELGVRTQVEYIGYLPDQELIQRLHGAVALIQPSSFEGFGLTGLEGMSVGVPVVASDLPVFAEVYGKHAYSFPKHDAIALAKVLKELWKHPPKRQVLQDAQRYAQRFSWDRTTQQTWEVLRSSWKGIRDSDR